MGILDAIMPYVANLVVLLLFTMPMIWGLFFTISLLGSLFGVIEKAYLKFESSLDKEKEEIFKLIDAKKPTKRKLKFKFQFNAKILKYTFVLLLVLVPIIFAAGLSINGFMHYHAHNQRMISSAPPVQSLVISAGPVVAEDVFNNNCAVCHQQDGLGVSGSFPPLAGSEWVTGKPENIIKIIIFGLSGEIIVNDETYNNVMSSFGGLLSNEEIVAVVNYIRTSFGNEAEPIDIDLVKSVKELNKNRSVPVTVSDLEVF